MFKGSKKQAVERINMLLVMKMLLVGSISYSGNPLKIVKYVLKGIHISDSRNLIQ